MAEKLKPCSHCGSDNIEKTVNIFSNSILLKIQCCECNTGNCIEMKSSETFETVENAMESIIAYWNRRADNAKA